MSALVILGDSAAAGVGDQVEEGIFKGWGHYLFTAMPTMKEYHNLSRPGARVSEMATIQLDLALSIKPKVAIFIIGGNDVLRNNFNPKEMYMHLADVTMRLQAIGCDVYGMNLHDPSRIIPLPKVLKKVLQRRVFAVNKVYTTLVERYNLKLLDISKIEEVYDKQMWHVDRMHPNKIGHQKLASYFANLLRANKYQIHPIYVESPTSASKVDNWMWMIKKGTPWFAKRSIDLFPVIFFLSICELLGLTDRIAPEFAITQLEELEHQLIA